MRTLQSKVTSKGQITLPKQIRTKLAIRTGDRLEFSLEKSNRISVRILDLVLMETARLRLVLKRFKAGKADLSDYLIHSVAESEGLFLCKFPK